MAHEFVSRADQTPNDPGVGDIVKLISDDVKTLVQGEVALAKAELVPSAKNAGIGAGLFGGAGYFAMNGLSLLFIAGALGFAKLFSAPTGWIALGFVVMAVVTFLIAGILALVGKGRLSKVKGPERTQAHAQATIEQVKAAVARANADAKTGEIERKNFNTPEPRHAAER